MKVKENKTIILNKKKTKNYQKIKYCKTKDTNQI